MNMFDSLVTRTTGSQRYKPAFTLGLERWVTILMPAKIELTDRREIQSSTPSTGFDRDDTTGATNNRIRVREFEISEVTGGDDTTPEITNNRSGPAVGCRTRESDRNALRDQHFRGVDELLEPHGQ